MQKISVLAASRLHFGMLSPSAGHDRRYGGAGVMVDSPFVHLQLRPAQSFTSDGIAADRVREFAHLWAQSRGDSTLPACHLAAVQVPEFHTGLGVGTQLGLAVARALNEFTGVGEVTPTALAASVGRGNRSAIGTYGFCHGGFLAEYGKSGGETLAPLECRVSLPESWKWLLIRPLGDTGLHGPAERRAFADLEQPCSNSSAPSHVAEMREQLVPAARRHDFAAFSDSLFRFGFHAGLSFQSIQGGAFNGPRLQHLVDSVRAFGIAGVGQSSWGPTIFALCRDEDQARDVSRFIREQQPDVQLTVTQTCNRGARVESIDA